MLAVGLVVAGIVAVAAVTGTIVATARDAVRPIRTVGAYDTRHPTLPR